MAGKFLLFFEAPSQKQGLDLFRIGIAGVALLSLYFYQQNSLEFLSPLGMITNEFTYALKNPWAPHLNHFYEALSWMGITHPATQFQVFACCYGGSLLLLMVGLFTRIASWVAFFLFLMFSASLQPLFYGLDIFIQIGLFYLCFFPSHKHWSVDRLLKRTSPAPSIGSNLSIRVLQIHCCLVYASAGIEKLAHPGWFNGDVLWHSFLNRDFAQFDLTFLAEYPALLIAFSILTLCFETFYPIGMWIPKIRLINAAGIVLLHLGISVFLGMPLFGIIMIVYTVSAWYDDLRKDALRLFHTPKANLQTST